MFLFLVMNFIFANEVQTVSQLDLQKYQGVWHELASIPASFQASCVKNTKANYKLLEDGHIQVTNTCEQENGDVKVAHALARVNPDFNEIGKLEVTFVKWIDWVWLFAGDYWVLKIGPNYQYVLVGHPDRDYGWILSRKQKQSKAFYKNAAKVFAQNGYDTCQILLSRNNQQNFVERPRLCDVIQ